MLKQRLSESFAGRGSGHPGAAYVPKPCSPPAPARWNEEAEAERHITEDFHVNKKTTVKVPMINCLGNFFLHRDKELSSWVLVQHYLGDTTAFAILPDPGKMEQVEKKLTQRHFEDILRAIDLR